MLKTEVAHPELVFKHHPSTSSALPAVTMLKRVELASPRISVLVRVKNEESALPMFWERLQQQTIFSSTEVVFLDSGSTDTTKAFLETKPCNLYALDGGFNFGKSCNQIADLATAPILMFLSGHVLLEQPDMLEQIALLLEHHKYSAAYVRQVPNPLFGFSLYEQAYLQRRFPPGVATRRLDQPASFSNAASAITRVAWLRHPFDEVHGSEDYLWASKHLASGGELFYMPQLQVLHSHNEDAEQVYDRVRINVVARSQTGSYTKAAYLFAGIYVSMRRTGASHFVALQYASAHAKAYL